MTNIISRRAHVEQRRASTNAARTARFSVLTTGLAMAGILIATVPSNAQSPTATTPNLSTKGTLTMNRATGTFEVKVLPQKPDNPQAESANIGRMALDKQFHGDLEAASTGEMLALRPDTQGSGGYVAIERIRGTLHGRNGSFALQHNGTMTRGVPSLTVTVIPDSGTGDLTGISGTMEIIIDSGKHSYVFNYQLP